MSSTSSKVVIIGIDGGTWDVLGPACDRGWMPNLNRFRKEGCWGTLKSVHPPITPAAWSSFMTGQNPGRHGILGFQRYDATANKVTLTNSGNIRSETLWQKLARAGKRSIVINVPMTYPPLKVNGFLMSGLETPSVDSEFTYPVEFKREILDKVPDLTFDRRYRSKALKKFDNFCSYIDWLQRQSEQMVEILNLGIEKGSWDVAMVLFRSFDELLHHYWKLLDFSYDTSRDKRSYLMEKYFKDLDHSIGELISIGERHDAFVITISDHGGQAKKGDIYPNRVLRKLGYIHPVCKSRRLSDYFSSRIQKDKKSNHPIAKSQKLKLVSEQCDLGKTTAYVTDVNIYASLYIQTTGRQATGIVDPKDMSTLVDDISKALLQVDDGHNKLFSSVDIPSSLYNLQEPDKSLPDLIIAPCDGYLMKSDVSGRKNVEYNGEKSLSGTHSMNGMFGVLGPGIKKGHNAGANIIDITPTVLAALNLPIAEDLDGVVLKDIFDYELSVVTEPSAKFNQNETYNFSDGDEQEIVSRLADLGYM